MAQTDEIQVYDGEIVAPGRCNMTLHNNYTPRGRAEPDFPGGIVPNRALNGVAEWAYGVNESLELGAYVPIYSVTGGSRLVWDGAKLRALFVSPHAPDRRLFYGVNFESGYNARRWESTRTSGEIRPILGTHLGPVDLIVNPILDTAFNGVGRLDFSPAERAAYNFSRLWAVALEHYADYGPIRRFDPVSEQQHEFFAVADYKGEPDGVELGVGRGFTDGSDNIVLKLMITHAF